MPVIPDQPGPDRRLRVFLCHSSGDKPVVRDLYGRLKTDGFAPWLDEEELLPGQDWREEIPKAVRTCDVVVVCMSQKSATKEGYLQREIRIALDAEEEKPEGTIFIVPLRLEEVEIPSRLRQWQWADWFREDGYHRLVRALKLRANAVGVNVLSEAEEARRKAEVELKAREEEAERLRAEAERRARAVRGQAGAAQAYRPYTLRQSLQGGGALVECVAFSRDGRLLASGFWDASGEHGDEALKLWDVGAGELKRTFGSGWVYSVAFSPDGRLLASGDTRARIQLWDVARGELSQILAGHDQAASSLAFSPDGHLLASGSSDNTVKLWDVAAGALSQTLTGHSDEVSCVAFSPDGRLLASGGGDDTIKLWDVATGALSQALTGYSPNVLPVAFSPDGRLLAFQDRRGISLWDVVTGQLQCLTSGGAVSWSLAFCPGGQLLASGTSSGTVQLWDIATGALKQTLTGGTGREQVKSLALSPDGHLLAFITGTAIRLWQRQKAEQA